MKNVSKSELRVMNNTLSELYPKRKKERSIITINIKLDKQKKFPVLRFIGSAMNLGTAILTVVAVKEFKN